MSGVIKVKQGNNISKKSIAGTTLDVGNYNGAKLVNTLNPKKLRMETHNLAKKKIEIELPRTADSPTRMMER